MAGPIYGEKMFVYCLLSSSEFPLKALSKFVAHCILNLYYSRLSLSRIPRDSLKYFEISVLRHIRFAELMKKLIRLTTFNKYLCNWTLEVRDILKILWKRGEISPFFHNIFYILLDFHV